MVTPLSISDLIKHQSILIVPPSDLLGPQMSLIESIGSLIYFIYNSNWLCNLNWHESYLIRPLSDPIGLSIDIIELSCDIEPSSNIVELQSDPFL